MRKHVVLRVSGIGHGIRGCWTVGASVRFVRCRRRRLGYPPSDVDYDEALGGDELSAAKFRRESRKRQDEDR
jgi:hypothetical protein